MKIYRVGGSVRDELLGLPVKDLDFVVENSSPEEMLQLGFLSVGKSFPVFLHPKTKEEYALVRLEKKTGVGYKEFSFDTNKNITINDDLNRRDLTINAIAIDENGKIIDPFGGVADLSNKILRHISPAFAEDPLRLFRVARFYARFAHLGFTIAPETLEIMHSLLDEIKYLSRERIWLETEKALDTANPYLYFETLIKVGALQIILDKNDLASSWTLTKKNADLHSCEQKLVNFISAMIDISTDISENLDKMGKYLITPVKYLEYSKLAESWLKLLLSNFSKEEIFKLSLKSDFKRKPEKIALVLQILTNFNENSKKFTEKVQNLATFCQNIKINPSDSKDDIIKNIQNETKAAIDIFFHC